MDYDSEEEEEEEGGDDNGKDKEDQVEEENGDHGQEESQSESAAVSVQRKPKRAGKEEESEASLDQMRVNTVLSNPAIERYCYDPKHELWCEVSVARCTEFI